MATPVSPQRINLPQCSFFIPAFVLPNSHIVQNNKMLTATRMKLSPYGPNSEGEMYFTRLKFDAKKIFVNKTAICALVVAFKIYKFSVHNLPGKKSLYALEGNELYVVLYYSILRVGMPGGSSEKKSRL